MTNYVIRVLDSMRQVQASQWDALLSQQAEPTPFMRHAYLLALETSGSACADTGWTPRILTLWDDTNTLAAACPNYLKAHSYGEYVFDWAWARAYQEHGLAYYPKGLTAVPFTPVPGSRLLARDAVTRQALAQHLQDWARSEALSSMHLLFAAPEDIAATQTSGWMQRQTVQFHWKNRHPGYADFEEFLSCLQQEKRKKIRQERRKVREAGVVFEHRTGHEISAADWDFFYRCYERTYLEHGNAPYLSREFFQHMAQDMPEHWLLFVAQRNGRPIASSLIGLQPPNKDIAVKTAQAVAYGRYWGALERVDCLHFEACYYQPLDWCIQQGYQRFEGGAQGEHKMARALLPVVTYSAHWLQHPAFSDAVERFLKQEGQGIEHYLDHLIQRTPLKRPATIPINTTPIATTSAVTTPTNTNSGS